MFYPLQSELEEKGAPDKSQALIKDLIKEWIRENEERQRTGQITQTTLRGKTSAMQGLISLSLLQHLGLKTVGEIQQDTSLGYRTWRVTEGWKHLTSPWGKVVPKDSIAKRDLVHAKDWLRTS